MNKNANNLNQNQDQLTEQQLSELENDAVWSLITEAETHSSPDVSPMFSRNVMREIRLNHSPTSPLPLSLFGRFNKIALGLGLGVAACAVLVITQLSDQNTTQDPVTTSTETIDELDKILIDDELNEFTEEMLEIANQDPIFITEEEIALAMQM